MCLQSTWKLFTATYRSVLVTSAISRRPSTIDYFTSYLPRCLDHTFVNKCIFYVKNLLCMYLPCVFLYVLVSFLVCVFPFFVSICNIHVHMKILYTCPWTKLIKLSLDVVSSTIFVVKMASPYFIYVMKLFCCLGPICITSQKENCTKAFHLKTSLFAISWGRQICWVSRRKDSTSHSPIAIIISMLLSSTSLGSFRQDIFIEDVRSWSRFDFRDFSVQHQLTC